MEDHMRMMGGATAIDARAIAKQRNARDRKRRGQDFGQIHMRPNLSALCELQARAVILMDTVLEITCHEFPDGGDHEYAVT